MVELFLFHFRVSNSKLKNKKLQFEFLTRWLKPLFFRFRATNSRLKNKKIQFELLTRGVHFYFLTFELRTRS